MASASEPLNGDPATLAVDRAIAELRRGRVVRVVAPEGARQVVAVESIEPAMLTALRLRAAGALRVATTAERARALGLGVAGEAVAWAVPADATLAALRGLAAADGDADDRVEGDARPAGARTRAGPVPGVLAAALPMATPQAASAAEVAALRLAKHARLLPTVLALPAAADDEPQVLSVSGADVARYVAAISLERISDAAVPLAEAERCRFVAFRDRRDGHEHVAIVVGEVASDTVVDVRVHSACLTGDLFGSLRCDCGDQLRAAVRRFAGLPGGGVLLYVAQEGRGIGLANKLRAYRLQEGGLDTIDADLHLGFAGDERRYEVAARLLQELGIARVRLHTNNPRKAGALVAAGVEVTGFRTLAGAVNPHNEGYIRTRRERAGHLVPDPE